MKNITRYIPQGFTPYTPDIGDYPKDLFAVYIKTDDPKKLAAIFYTGKQSKHTWFYGFPRIEDMKSKINETISGLMAWEDRKAERKAKRATATADVKVGQIYSYSWGYDQTNVDFFQVTAVNGKRFTIQEIGGKRADKPADGGSMSDYVVAVRDSFLHDSKPMLKQGFHMAHGVLSLTDDKEPHYRSWYH